MNARATESETKLKDQVILEIHLNRSNSNSTKIGLCSSKTSTFAAFNRNLHRI